HMLLTWYYNNSACLLFLVFPSSDFFPSRFDHLFVSIRSLVLHLPVHKFPCLYYGSNIMHIQYVQSIKLTPHFSIYNVCAFCFFSFFLLCQPTLAITPKPIIS